MPKLVRLYIVNVLIGFAVAGLFVALLLWLDVAHLRQLVFGKGPAGQFNPIAFGLLFVSHGLVFAGVQFAIAVMSMAAPSEPPQGGLRAPLLTSRLEPVKLTLPPKRG